MNFARLSNTRTGSYDRWIDTCNALVALTNCRTTNFADRARWLWGGQVSWRMAMPDDATIAIATGLPQSDVTRQGLQQALVRSRFSAAGASGTVKFLSTGNRQLQPAIVSVRQCNGKWIFTMPQSQP